MLKKLFTGVRLLVLVALIALIAVIAMGQSYVTKIYRDRGGNREVIASGGVLDVRTGGRLVLKGDTVDTYLSAFVSPGADSLIVFDSTKLAVAGLLPVKATTSVIAGVHAVGTTAGYTTIWPTRAWRSAANTITVHMHMNPADSVRLRLLILR